MQSTCLKCKKTFESVNPKTNRICQRCRNIRRISENEKSKRLLNDNTTNLNKNWFRPEDYRYMFNHYELVREITRQAREEYKGYTEAQLWKELIIKVERIKLKD